MYIPISFVGVSSTCGRFYRLLTSLEAPRYSQTRSAGGTNEHRHIPASAHGLLRARFARASQTIRFGYGHFNTKKLHRLIFQTPERLSKGYQSLCTHTTLTRCSPTPRSDRYFRCPASAHGLLRARFARASQTIRSGQQHFLPLPVFINATVTQHKDRTWHAPQKGVY